MEHAEGVQHALARSGRDQLARPADPGFVRWSTVDGATGYQVWFLNTPAAGRPFSTITNVADEREYYVAGRQPSGPVLWRVRAARQASHAR